MYFISEAESYFLQAEAVVRGWGTGDAQSLYENGVKASFRQNGLTEADAIAYLTPVAGQPSVAFPASGTPQDQIKAIITQKWVALAGTYQDIEAFIERNRTNYPNTSLVARTTSTGYIPGEFVYPVQGVTGAGNFAKRLVFPESERTRNPNTPAQEPVTKPVWWDVN